MDQEKKKGLSQAHNALDECSFFFWVLFRRGCRLISLIDLPFGRTGWWLCCMTLRKMNGPEASFEVVEGHLFLICRFGRSDDYTLSYLPFQHGFTSKEKKRAPV